jgi:hypothetical protein
MKQNLILIFTLLFFVSCSVERQDTKQHELNSSSEEIEDKNQTPVVFENDQVKASSTFSKDNSLATASIEKTICLDQDVSEWYGFKEQDVEDAQCKPIKYYKISNYQCEKRLAFEEGFEAMFILAPNATIISYSGLSKCNQAKEIWESNAP